MAKRYNIVIGKKYDNNGEEKTQWNNVGKLVYFPATAEKKEGFILELHMFQNIKFSVFPETPKEQGGNTGATRTTQAQSKKESMPEVDIDYPEDVIDPEDIPF